MKYVFISRSKRRPLSASESAMDRMWSSVLWKPSVNPYTPDASPELWPSRRSVLALFAVRDVYASLCKKALTLHLARSEGHERYFACNLMHCKVLASSHQHLMAEAAENRVRAHIFLCMLSYYVLWHMMCIGSA